MLRPYWSALANPEGEMVTETDDQLAEIVSLTLYTCEVLTIQIITGNAKILSLCSNRLARE